MPMDGEVCLPLPVLQSESLRLWRSPRSLVGGEALRLALKKSTKEGDAEVDIGEEVSIPLSPTTFDKKAKVVERNVER